MLVKILDADDAFVEKLKLDTGATTASKAYAYAAERFAPLSEYCDDLNKQIFRLKTQLADADRTIASARSAAKVLLDHVSQASLEL